MSNKVFYQHPNLMRALGMHETVMEVMVNVLGGGDSKVLFFFLKIYSNQSQSRIYTHLVFHVRRRSDSPGW